MCYLYYNIFFVVQITSMPFVHNVGPLRLSTEPVKHFLEGLATRRKVKYASLLHERARVSIWLLSLFFVKCLYNDCIDNFAFLCNIVMCH